MAFSTDDDLTALIPDILDLGIAAFDDFHADAEADIERDIRVNWWSKTGYPGELDASLIDVTQFTKASAYLVLWKYALPQLTNWTDGDRFQVMIDFYKSRYNDEMAAIYADGVRYDYDDNGSISQAEKSTTIRRLAR